MYQIKGKIDSTNAMEFEKEIMSALPSELDASELEYISSAGLRVLLKLTKAVGDVVIQNVNSEVYEIFDVTGFTGILTVKKALREISIEGCELIGSGGYGKVYRLDDETIAKIYNPGISLSFVEQERNTSQKAFLMGVPTAISFDVVTCGDRYGVVYEMLDAKTMAQIIDADPSMIQPISAKSAMLLKELHQIAPDADTALPDRKEKMLAWVDSIADYITAEEAEKIKGFIGSIPDRNTFLHGDYNAKNIMICDGEFRLIDIGDAAIGHPVFDIAGLILAYIILPSTRGGSRSDEDLRGLLGFDFSYAQQVWGVMCATYFGLTSPDEIKATTMKLMPYCLLLMTFHSISIVGGNEDMIKVRIDKILRDRLLPAIDTAQPLDF
ncbi:MAG: phosphotransferase [Ruminococcus sp.]|nr:phosphotransferase [Ruminococcus sp.]